MSATLDRSATGDEVRGRGLAGRHGGRGQGHPERGDQHLALAETVLGTFGEVDRRRDRAGDRGQTFDDVVGADTVLGGGHGERRRRHPAGQFGEGGVARVGERLGHRHHAEVEPVVVRDHPVADLHHSRAGQQSVGGGHVTAHRSPGGDDLERRTGRVQPRGRGRPVRIRGAVLRDREDLAGRGFDHDQHGLAPLAVHGMLGGVLDEAVESQRDRRRRLGRNLGEDLDVGTVLVDADHPPAGFAVQVVEDGFFDLADDRGRETVVGGQHFGLRRHHHPGQRVEGPDDFVMVGGPQRDEIQGPVRRAGLFGQALRVQRVVELPQHVGDHPGTGHQIAPGPGGVELVAVEAARHQDFGAAQFVDRGPPRWICAKLDGLVLAELGVQRAGAPADPPPALVADHVQHAVVGPVALLGQFPGEPVVHAAGVLGVARAEDLNVEMAGLQAGPGLVERGVRVGGPIAELCGRAGVTAPQAGEELSGGRSGAVRPGRAGRHRRTRRHDRQEQACDSCCYWGESCH